MGPEICSGSTKDYAYLKQYTNISNDSLFLVVYWVFLCVIGIAQQMPH